jgi:hypothetical protein
MENVKVRHSFHADASKIGTEEEVPVDEAKRLVRQGRAVYATKTAAKVAAKPTPADTGGATK